MPNCWRWAAATRHCTRKAGGNFPNWHVGRFASFAFRVSRFALRISHFAFRTSRFALRISHFAFRVSHFALCILRSGSRVGHRRLFADACYLPLRLRDSTLRFWELPKNSRRYKSFYNGIDSPRGHNVADFPIRVICGICGRIFTSHPLPCGTLPRICHTAAMTIWPIGRKIALCLPELILNNLPNLGAACFLQGCSL